MPEKIEVDESDLLKIYDALDEAVRFHLYRDRMNATLHKSIEVRLSPLTSTLLSERNRLGQLAGIEATDI